MKAFLFLAAILLPQIALAQAAEPQQRVVAMYLQKGDHVVHRVQMRQSGTMCPVYTADATLRQRIVDLAASQWAAFGFQMYDISSRIPEFFPGGDNFQIVPPRLNPQFAGAQQRLLRIGVQEDNRMTDAYIGSYWATTPQAQEILAQQNKVWEIAENAGWINPWSAAFVSWVMCEAGLTDTQFPRSAAHSTYVNGLLAQQTEKPVYKAVDVQDAGVPHAGDVICADRGQPAVTRLKDYPAKAFRPLHCDVVVKRDWAHNRVFAIGGNVQDGVTLTAIRITKTGEKFHLEPTGYRPWFVVLQLQTGGRADLAKAPIKMWR